MVNKNNSNTSTESKISKGAPSFQKWKPCREVKGNLFLYILVLPGLLYYLVFRYIPMYGLIIAFKDFKLGRGIWGSEWAGFMHFERLFNSIKFFELLRNTLILNITTLICGFSAALILSLLLNELVNVAYRTIIQKLIYIPHFISWVILGALIYQILSPSSGIINAIIKNVFNSDPIYFMSSPVWWRVSYVAVDMWHGVGWGTILFMASIAQINPQLYESSIIDGASRLKRMWHITLPGIKGTIAVLLILSTGHMMELGLEKILVLQNPLVMDVADVMSSYIYRAGINGGQYSYTTAVGFFQSLVGLIFIVTANKIVKTMGENGLW